MKRLFTQKLLEKVLPSKKANSDNKVIRVSSKITIAQSLENLKKLLGKVLPSKKANSDNNVVSVSSKPIHAQSAMEYLMTYGWAILLIAVVLVAFFTLGVFNGNGSAIPTSCTAQSGFLCSNPVMDTTGNVLVNFGQSSGSTITVQATACSNSSAAPSPTAWVQQPVNNPTFITGITGTLGFQCSLSSNVIGTKFSGTLWIQYQKNGVSGQEAEIGIFTAKAGAPIAINLGNTGSGSSGGSGETLSGLASLPTLVYNTGSGETSTSATVTSGNVIICAAAVGMELNQGVNAGLTPSWTSNANDIYKSTSVGHQTGLTCSASANTNANITMGAISVTTNLPYTVTSSSGQEISDSYQISYTLSHTSYVIILVACGEEAGGNPCNFNTPLPSGCSQLFQNEGYNDYSESVLGIVCNEQSSGDYSFIVYDYAYPNGAMVSYSVYAFNIQTNPVCALINTPDSEIFLSGLKSTTLTTTQSCGATNFQWYEEAPGASSFSEISGATSNTYTFSPSSGAATGTYQFDVQTSNNQGNQATSIPINVLVTNNPYAYVTNSNANNVSIVDVTTGNVLDAITSEFYGPQGIAFYSGNVYITNLYSSNIIEINPTNSNVIGTPWTSGFNHPSGIAFYSGNAYVVNEEGGTSFNGNVVEINPTNGNIISSWSSGFYYPQGITFYSGNAYIVNEEGGSNYLGNVIEINPTNGIVIDSWNSGFEDPFETAFYSGNAYVVNANSNNVIEINPINGNVIGTPWTSGISSPYGITFYSGNAYITNVNYNNIVKINPINGDVIGSWNSGFEFPEDVAFST